MAIQSLLKLDLNNQLINTQPEIELLLCCVRPQINDATVTRIKDLVQENIDWQTLIQTAYGHGVISLLYTRLNTICPQAIPQSILNQLQSLFQSIARRNLFLTGELIKLLGLLKEEGIVAVPYKGPVLATLIYGNVALRQFVDLDILVQRQDIFTVKKLLLSQGYQPKVEMSHVEEVAYLQSTNEHTHDFIHNDKGILIEVHWRIAPKYLSIIEPKHLWQDLEPFSFAGTTVNYLSSEYWLPILCVHGSRHMWERLAWLCDIARLVQNNPDLNWDKVLKQAKVWGCRRMLFLGLFLTHYFLGIDLPENILQQIKAEPEITILLTQVYDQLFDSVKTSDKFFGRTIYQIQVRERLQDKFIYLQSFVKLLIAKKVSSLTNN
jgi:hypothetical protein